MSVPIFLSYIDFCKEHHHEPNVTELKQWKLKYNNR